MTINPPILLNILILFVFMRRSVLIDDILIFLNQTSVNDVYLQLMLLNLTYYARIDFIMLILMNCNDFFPYERKGGVIQGVIGQGDGRIQNFSFTIYGERCFA